MENSGVRFLSSALLVLIATASQGPAAQRGDLRAGAAKVEITPSEGNYPPPYKTVLDPIFVRALVLDNGNTRVGMITADAVNMETEFWSAAAPRIAREGGIREANLQISVTHSHSSPRLVKSGDLAAVAYGEKVRDAMGQALKQASAALAPARIGYGTGSAHLNVNRDWFNPADNHWYLYQPYQGTNDQRPSDKTVAVLKIEKTNGELIALYVNYGLHAVVNNGGGGSEVSGDFPGAMSRYIEAQSGEKMVALWTSGAAGDQHPIFKVWIDRKGGAIPEEKAKTHVLVNTFGQMLAEEALFVASHIQTSSAVALDAAQKVVTCPGKVTTPRNHPMFCAYPGWPVSASGLPACGNYKDTEGPSVDIRLSLLMIDKIAMAGVSGELLTDLGYHVKRASPYSQTMIVALTNGSSGYIPDDANYDKFTYESTTTRIRRGCAENSIVTGFNELMGRY